MRLRWTAMIAASVVVAVGAGDQGLRIAAEHKLAKQTNCRLHAAHSSVGIGGLLLGPQLVRNRFSHITVHSTDVRETDGLVDLSADLYGVHPLSKVRLNAAHGSVTVTVPFSTIGAQAGKNISASASQGQLEFTSTDTTDGTVGSVVYADVALDGDDVVVTPVRVDDAGKPVSWAQAERTAKRTGQSLAPRRVKLPPSLTALGLRSASATPAGLLLQAAGPNLTITLPDVPGC